MNPRAWPRHSALVVLPLIVIAGMGAASGGYFGTALSWTALAFAWACGVVVVLAAPRWGMFDRVWLAAAAALCLFTFISAAWAGSVDAAVQAGERTLVYLTGIAVALVVLRRGDFTRWLGGLVLGAAGVCSYSLATRLYPTHFGGLGPPESTADYRLFTPVGYWNALGIFAGIALLLGFGTAAVGRVVWLRVSSAVALVVFAPTMYFTFSRGAFIAFAIGVLAMFAISRRRMHLLGAAIVLAPAPTVGVLLASRFDGLTQRYPSLAAASHDGRALAADLAVLALVQLALACGLVFVAARLKVSRIVSRALGIAVAIAIAAALVGVVAKYGSPPTIARHAYRSFVSPPVRQPDLNGRLFSLSNDNRTVLWRAAWNEFLAHPAVGSGAGGFTRWWLAHRPYGSSVLDAHNLYVQTLGELGVVGFALLVLFLGLPLVAALRARWHPLVAPAFGAYVAYLAHAIIDWDWQVPAVTLFALFGSAVIVAAARPRKRELVPMGQWARVALGTGAAVAAAVAFIGLLGNIALARANSALLNGSGKKAVAAGASAHRWAPWSTQALKDLGGGRLLLGERRAGLASLREAAAKDPGDWETWFEIAAATSGAERRAALARAKALNPQSPEIADVEAPSSP